MKQITTADIRKDAGNWKGQFLVKKMKQGRDNKVDKHFIVTEVSAEFYQECATKEGISLEEWLSNKDSI